MASDIPTTMKAVVVRETGTASKLLLERDYPTPQLKPRHALVRNAYAGINFIDTYHRSGLYARDLPFICGQEGGGTIVAMDGGDVDNNDFQVGDRVIYGTMQTYCEYSLVPLSQLIKIPSGVTMEDAVVCLCQGLTAHYLVTDAHANLILPQQWMLIYSVGSGTGQWAAQMAKIKGYKVIGTCSQGKQEQAKLAGCDSLIVIDTVAGKGCADYESSSATIVEQIMNITNQQGAHCILDGVGKATADISLQCLARRGIFVSFGNASGAVPAFPVLKLTPKSAFVTRPKLSDYIATREELVGRMSDIWTWLEKGQLKVSVDRIFDLEQAVAAHEYIESGQSRGKLLLRL